MSPEVTMEGVAITGHLFTVTVKVSVALAVVESVTVIANVYVREGTEALTLNVA